MTRNRVLVAVLVTGALAAPSRASAADYHHVHITAASPLQAVDWYARHMGCEPVTDRSDAANCYGVEVVFVPQTTTGTSQGTGVDHIAFSVADLPAKMAELEAVGVRGSGVRLQRNDDGSTWRDVPGLFKIAFIFDPWGTHIELVEDPETLGFHHVHLSAADPDATLAWYRDVMGGAPASLKGQLDGLRFGDVWFLVSRNAEGMPGSTVERAIDHIAFVVDDLDSAAADFRRQDVRFEQEPGAPQGGRTSAKRAFLAGPDNVRVAVVETGFAGVESDIGSTILTTDALGPYDAPRTPWGEPDLQGIWTSSSAVGIPFERPEGVDADEVTPEVAIARHEGRLLGGIWGYEREWRDTTLEYGSAVSTQMAMVIDPADGRLPPRVRGGERPGPGWRRPGAAQVGYPGRSGEPLDLGPLHHPRSHPDARGLQQWPADRAGAWLRRDHAGNDPRNAGRSHNAAPGPRRGPSLLSGQCPRPLGWGRVGGRDHQLQRRSLVPWVE